MLAVLSGFTLLQRTGGSPHLFRSRWFHPFFFVGFPMLYRESLILIPSILLLGTGRRSLVNCVLISFLFLIVSSKTTWAPVYSRSPAGNFFKLLQDENIIAPI